LKLAPRAAGGGFGFERTCESPAPRLPSTNGTANAARIDVEPEEEASAKQLVFTGPVCWARVRCRPLGTISTASVPTCVR
jgi:hypothetical protein